MDLTTFRQGDVLLVKEELPKSWLPVRMSRIPRDQGRLVLAYGEVTGHAHVIDAPPTEATLLSGTDNERFLELVADAPLVHEEHSTINIPAGTYRVVQQEQFAPPRDTTERLGRSLRVGD